MKYLKVKFFIIYVYNENIDLIQSKFHFSKKVYFYKKIVFKNSIKFSITI